MTRIKHTPGPWEAKCSLGGWYVDAANDADDDQPLRDPICDVHSPSAAANACLIAAAPDLLEALRQMVANSQFEGKSYRDCHKKAMAAIAKAEGLT